MKLSPLSDMKHHMNIMFMIIKVMDLVKNKVNSMKNQGKFIGSKKLLHRN